MSRLTKKRVIIKLKMLEKLMLLDTQCENCDMYSCILNNIIKELKAS
ncbi:MAG: hypothetical protein N4A63_01425 [Vallitalea sp.]|nr:hypothetical protein [Vallitalea sp.]